MLAEGGSIANGSSAATCGRCLLLCQLQGGHCKIDYLAYMIEASEQACSFSLSTSPRLNANPPSSPHPTMHSLPYLFLVSTLTTHKSPPLPLSGPAHFVAPVPPFLHAGSGAA